MCFIGVLEINTKTLKFRFKILQRIHGNEFWGNQKSVRTKGIFIKTKNNHILLTPTSGELKGSRIYKYLRELPQQIPNFR
jgi:hypothetical protein